MNNLTNSDFLEQFAVGGNGHLEVGEEEVTEQDVVNEDRLPPMFPHSPNNSIVSIDPENPGRVTTTSPDVSTNKLILNYTCTQARTLYFLERVGRIWKKVEIFVDLFCFLGRSN